jgi:hypothetical protein
MGMQVQELQVARQGGFSANLKGWRHSALDLRIVDSNRRAERNDSSAFSLESGAARNRIDLKMARLQKRNASDAEG